MTPGYVEWGGKRGAAGGKVEVVWMVLMCSLTSSLVFVCVVFFKVFQYRYSGIHGILIFCFHSLMDRILCIC